MLRIAYEEYITGSKPIILKPVEKLEKSIEKLLTFCTKTNTISVDINK